ncbi:MAG: FIST C-terminal domain-containing protein [Candidatus Omnitrophica bacterium]|nr:FIST C-terminal domain-containing protein [Candidatus Omnitrophota bacterium]
MAMRFTSGISDAVNASDAAELACRQVLEQLGPLSCDLACAFASPIYRTEWPQLLEAIHRRLKPKALIGCSGSGIIGGTQELEWVPAISVVGAHLPQVRLHPFVVSSDELEASSPGGFWIDKIGVSPEAHPVFVVVVDPYTSDPRKLVSELSATYRHAPIVGGLVSGGNEPGQHLAFMGTDVYREGAVGVAMAGNITMETVISQGCRPIGRPWIVTKAEDNIIWELAGRQALAVLHEVLSSLSPDDRELAQQGSIFVGLAFNEMRQAFGSGDFLIRNIVGIDPGQGAIAVSDQVETGQTVQFQLRDPSTSRQELRRLVQQVYQLPNTPPPAGCLVFNCTGRGKSLYGTSHHDIRTIQMVSGKLPVGGFFCNGEIGPIRGTNLLHGYTASLALFRPLDLSKGLGPAPIA